MILFFSKNYKCVKKIVKHQLAHSLGSFATRYGYGSKVLCREAGLRLHSKRRDSGSASCKPQVLIHSPTAIP